MYVIEAARVPLYKIDDETQVRVCQYFFLHDVHRKPVYPGI